MIVFSRLVATLSKVAVDQRVGRITCSSPIWRFVVGALRMIGGDCARNPVGPQPVNRQGGYSLYEDYYICSVISTPLLQVSGKFV